MLYCVLFFNIFIIPPFQLFGNLALSIGVPFLVHRHISILSFMFICATFTYVDHEETLHSYTHHFMVILF